MIFNNLQSTLESEIVASLNKEELGDLMEVVNSCQFVAHMISPSRKRAKDLERDKNGKITVVIEELHILEDMDYFRAAALYFQEHQCYTHLHPNAHPHSEFAKYWKEEARRCREGYIREYDGEWVPGDLYWYWNYSPILQTKQREGKKRGDRIMDFPRPYDGDYMFFHYQEQAREDGEHGSVLKSRGKGFSFKGGSGLAKRFILGDSAEATKKVKAYAIANEREYLTKDGVLNKFIDVIDFCSENTPFPNMRELKNSWNDMHWQMGYVDSESERRMGSQNEVMGVTLKNDPQKARGKRGSYIIWEEMGKFPNFLQAWQIARPSVEEDEVAFGLMMAYGTGGTEGADFSGASEIFYNPTGYKVKKLRNVFDKNTKEGAECAFFFADYLNKKECYDSTGNSDIIKALALLMKARYITKYNTSDPNAIVQEKAEKPIYPQEAVMRKEGNGFPVYDLKERLAEISPSIETFVASHLVGRLLVTGEGKVKWEQDFSIRPIRHFPVQRGTDTTGGVEIFTPPQKNSRGTIPRYRYIMGVDPVDSDAGSSLASAFVFDTFTRRIVAEYTARPRFANDFYEIVLRLSLYYNAIINYENNIKGLYTYFYQKNQIHLLCDNPQVLKDLNMQKGSNYGNGSKGTRANADVNRYARRMQRDWMLQKGYDSTDELPLMNLHGIRSIAYMQEAIDWNEDGNFDRVSAMGMVMILWEEVRKYSDVAKQDKPINDFANAKFFKDNYGGQGRATKDFFDKIKKGELAIDNSNIISDFTNKD